MGIKLAWTGIGLSELGLAQFIPAVSVAGAVVLVIGVVLIWLDR